MTKVSGMATRVLKALVVFVMATGSTCVMSERPASALAVPQKVVSINLCTDELAIQLARPGQLVAVTQLVQDPLLSEYWKSAKDFPSHNNSLEQIIRYRPDLILASQWTSSVLLNRLKQLGYTVYRLPAAKSQTQLYANILMLGQRLGNSRAAESMVARLKSKIRSLQHVRGKHRRMPGVLLYYPGGWTQSGKGLLAQLLTIAGFRDMALAKNKKQQVSGSWHSVSLEQLATSDLDILIVIDSYSRLRSNAAELLQHPVLRYFRQQKRIVSLPTQWLSCGSPATYKILSRLLSARQNYLRRQQHE